MDDRSTMQASESQTVSQAPDNNYQGVRGWLLFFCIVLTIINPLRILVSLGIDYNEIAPLFAEFPGLYYVYMIDSALRCGMACFGIYAGSLLWRVMPGAVVAAKRFLLCSLGYTAVAAVLPFMAGLPASANKFMIPEVIKGTLRGLISFGIWYTYLNRSKRVKATYFGVN